jgi:RHS repeat-associated protein
MTGPMAEVNPIRFSTQYADDVTGDLKYLYRDYRADFGRWLSRDPIGELGGSNPLYAVVRNDRLDRIDVLGLVEFEFVVIKNETGKNRGNNSGDWGSPGIFFSGSESVTPQKSATTTVTGSGPLSGWCCNTVISRKEPSNGNAGSIFVYMKDADPGTYSVQLDFSGSASITIATGEKTAGHSAGATLNFYAVEKLVLTGAVYLGSKGDTSRMNWTDAKGASAVVSIGKKADRVLVGKYDLSMRLSNCGNISVKATGTVSVGGYQRLK